MSQTQSDPEPGETLFEEKHVRITQQTNGRVGIQVADDPGDVVDRQALVEALQDVPYVGVDELHEDRFYLCVTCGRLKHSDLFEKGDCTCLDCYDDVEQGVRESATVKYQEAPNGDGFVLRGQNKPENNLDGAK